MLHSDSLFQNSITLMKFNTLLAFRITKTNCLLSHWKDRKICHFPPGAMLLRFTSFKRMYYLTSFRNKEWYSKMKSFDTNWFSSISKWSFKPNKDLQVFQLASILQSPTRHILSFKLRLIWSSTIQCLEILKHSRIPFRAFCLRTTKKRGNE